MERFIPVEMFRKKSNTFGGITFFPFLPKRAKFSVAFVWITSARLHNNNNNNNNNNNCLFTNPNRKSEKEIKEVIPF